MTLFSLKSAPEAKETNVHLWVILLVDNEAGLAAYYYSQVFIGLHERLCEYMECLLHFTA
jgi:hypothetical protein